MRATAAIALGPDDPWNPHAVSGSCGVVRLGADWYAFRGGEIDEQPFRNKLDALDWLRVKVREAEILARAST